MSLIVENEIPIDEPIPTGKIVYTVKCDNIFELKQQKVNNTINFGDLVQTVNINTVDSKGLIHKGLAFVAKL